MMTTRKVIAIGESVLDTVFGADGQPKKSMVGGRIACAAASLARMGIACHMMSECGADDVGHIVIDFLSRNGVDVTSVDRYTDGTTRLAAIFHDEAGGKRIVNYGRYPSHDRFNVVWPRVERDDIVLYGSLYAVEQPQRERVLDFLRHAAERGAILVCLPGLQHGIGYRITHVMPAILENIEMAHLIVTHDSDMATLFPGEAVDAAFRNHFEFYDDTMSLHIHDTSTVTMRTRTIVHDTRATGYRPTNWLGWQAGFVAGIIHRIIARDIRRGQLHTLNGSQWSEEIVAAMSVAQDCAAAADNCVSVESAADARAALDDIPTQD